MQRDFGGRFSESLLACAFFGFYWRSACTHQLHCLARIIPRWPRELRWLWTSVPWIWEDVCEPVSLMGFHIMPGQHSQPTLTLLDQGCMRIYLSALLVEWPGSFTCQCSNTGVDRTLNKSGQKVNSGEENSPATPAKDRIRGPLIMSPLPSERRQTQGKCADCYKENIDCKTQSPKQA